MATSNLNYRALPLSERIELVEDIWDSIAEETPSLALSAEERAELHRRLTAHRADPSSGIPWEQVREELSSKLPRLHVGLNDVNREEFAIAAQEKLRK